MVRIAYGRDGLTQERKEAFLNRQLQDGLHSDLIQNPSLSGTLGYKQLCRLQETRKGTSRYADVNVLSHCPQGPAPSETDKEVQVAFVVDIDVESEISTLLKLYIT